MDNLIILESVNGTQLTGMDVTTGEQVIAVVTLQRAAEVIAIIDDAVIQEQMQPDDPIDREFDAGSSWMPVLSEAEFFKKEVS